MANKRGSLNINLNLSLKNANMCTKWSEADLSNLNINTWNYSTRNFQSSPFPIDPVLNSRISLWYGDVMSLSVDGLVQTTNETLDDLPLSVISRTGSQYKELVWNELRSIRTGDAALAPSHPNLPCRHMILTVAPRYSIKFKSAAETALHSCYSCILQKASERKLDTIAVPAVHRLENNVFPDEQGAHIAIRTVRRFLEKGYMHPQRIILAVSEPSLFQLYQYLMLCYFPREPTHEDFACVRLPLDTGDNDGAPWLPDRRIRIFSNPAEKSTNDVGYEESMNFPEEINKEFLEMKEDIDREKLLGDERKRRSFSSLKESEKQLALEIESKEKFERILRRARMEDLSCIQKTGCLYKCGVDRLGRPIVVVVGKWFRPEEMDLDKAFLYLVRILDQIDGPYCVVYFHSSTGPENRPNFRWMRAVYDNMEYRFKKNLKAFCIVHPTLWTRVLCWWFTTFMAPAIKDKLQNLPGLNELYAMVEPSQVKIPVFITEIDITLYGFGAKAYSVTHSSNGSSPIK